MTTVSRRGKRSLRSSAASEEGGLSPQKVLAATEALPHFTIPELNSSPVKQKKCERDQQQQQQEHQREQQHDQQVSDCSSSPIKRKKMVVFSDDFMAPSSPRENRLNMSSPLKSILKPLEVGDNSIKSLGMTSPSMWAKVDDVNSERNPANPLFWHVGTIIQLAPGSAELPQLVNGILTVLKDGAFSRKFEVYAALNHLCKVNHSETLYKLLAISNDRVLRSPSKSSPIRNSQSHINSLCEFIQRDLLSLESELFQSPENGSTTEAGKIDPFCTRIINQALKLMAFLMSDQELNNFISIEHSRWFYLHSCEMTVKPTLSKTLVLSYLVILKDCKFSHKKKKQIFDPNTTTSVSSGKDIPEQILYSLLNMKGFQSSSLVVEKFVAIKNLIINFPTMMSKNVNHWFPVLLVNLCDLNSPLYSKIINMGIQTLLESARNFIDNKNVVFVVKRFLSTNLPAEVKSLSSEQAISPSSQFINDTESSSGQILAFDFVTSNLEELIRNGQFKAAMDIWVALTLLTGGNVSNNGSNGYESWPFLSKWLKVHKYCFNQQDNMAKVIALTSWKAIVYNVCHNDLDNIKKHHDVLLIKEAGASSGVSSNGETVLLTLLKPKIKLLLHPLLNVTSVESQREIIDVLNNLFLSILYTILNPNTHVTNATTTPLSSKYIHIYWDKIIQPILANFYFKKEISNSYMNQLGINILNRLLVPAQATSNFNDLRCLSNEPVTLTDITSLSSKWIFSKFDRIMQNLVIVFKLEKLSIDLKLSFFMNFLNCVKFTTKKEIKPSPSTYDIIDNLPFVLNILFKNNIMNYEQVYKIVIGLNDTFGPSNLIGKSNDEGKSNVFHSIAKNLKDEQHGLKSQEVQDIFGLVYAAIGDNLNLCFVNDIIKLEQQNSQMYHSQLQLQLQLQLQEENKENENPTQPKNIKSQLEPESGESESLFKAFYQPILNSRRINKNSNYELKICSSILQIIETDFEPICKRLIQDIVLGSAEEFERLCGILKVGRWSMPVFKYFIYLMHDAPHYHLKQMTLNLILIKWEDSQNGELFIQILRFLIENKFNFELFNLKKNVMKKYNSLDGYFQYEFKQVWQLYLASVCDSNNFVLLDDLLVSALEVDIDVKPFIKNQWEKLPVLKEKWLKLNSELYIDKSLIEKEESEASFADKGDSIMEEGDSSNQLSPLKTLPPTESPDKNEADETNESPSKTPSKRGKGGRKARVTRKKATPKANTSAKKVAKEPPKTNFDIHSFTAMLTAKLSTPTPKKERVSRKIEKESPKQQVEDLVPSPAPTPTPTPTPTATATATATPPSTETAVGPTVVEENNALHSDNTVEMPHSDIQSDSMPSNSTQSNISESLEELQNNSSLQFDESFDYEMYVKHEEISKSPEIEGTMDKEVIISQDEDSQSIGSKRKIHL